MIAFTIVCFAAMLLIDIPQFPKKRRGYVVFVYGLFYVAALVLCLLLSMNINVPSIMTLVADFMEGVLGLSY